MVVRYLFISGWASQCVIFVKLLALLHRNTINSIFVWFLQRVTQAIHCLLKSTLNKQVFLENEVSLHNPQLDELESYLMKGLTSVIRAFTYHTGCTTNKPFRSFLNLHRNKDKLHVCRFHIMYSTPLNWHCHWLLDRPAPIQNFTLRLE